MTSRDVSRDKSAIGAIELPLERQREFEGGGVFPLFALPHFLKIFMSRSSSRQDLEVYLP